MINISIRIEETEKGLTMTYDTPPGACTVSELALYERVHVFLKKAIESMGDSPVTEFKLPPPPTPTGRN